MQKRHTDRVSYFSEQSYTTKKYVIPFISDFMQITPATTVLEIGCGEAGNLKPFVDLGCKCTGIDLDAYKISIGKELFKTHENVANLELIAENIYNIDGNNLGFDLIIMRDVIEHIPNQARFMEHLKAFLKPEGKVFFGFPPWQNPFGGHQQVCQSKISLVPYIHLLPTKLYRKVLEVFEEPQALFGAFAFCKRFKWKAACAISEARRGEARRGEARRGEARRGEARRGEGVPNTVEGLLEIKSTGINIEQFRKILKQANYITEKETFYFINPNYEIKFNLKPRKLFYPLGLIPYLRNFYTTAVYCIVKKG